MGGFVTMMFYIPPPEIYRAWCDPYVSFCLFSEGRANNLSQAESKCIAIKEGSWPVELLSKDFELVFGQYIRNHSISNVILSAFKYGERWQWRNGSTIENFTGMSVINETLIYNSQGHVTEYEVVCTAECPANWTSLYGLNYESNSTKQSNLSIHDCKTDCSKNSRCSSILVLKGIFGSTCLHYGYPYNLSRITTSYFGSSHHIIDRSMRNVETCIGDYEGKKPTFNWDFLMFIIAIIGVILLFLLLALCKQKRKFFTTGDTKTSGPSEVVRV